MFFGAVPLLICLALIASSKAQFPTGIISGISSECIQGLGTLATDPYLDQCLHFNEALIAFSSSGPNTSVVPAFNTYLTGSFCPGSACNTTTLTNANNNITSSCSAELQNFTSIPSSLSYFFRYYDSIRLAFCLQDAAPNNDLCAIQTMNNMQTASDQNFTINTLLGLNSNTLRSFADTLGQQNQSLLCSDCNKAIGFIMEPSLNSSQFAQRFADSYEAECGNFAYSNDLRQTANRTSLTANGVEESENSAAIFKIEFIGIILAGAVAFAIANVL